MIDQVTLDRVQLVREMISEYEDALSRERVRLDALRLDWVRAELYAREMEEQGDADSAHEARKARLEAHEIQRRVEATEEEIDRMEQLLAVFRRKLLELQRDR